MTDAASAGPSFERIIEAAREHYENLRTDISNAKDRVEYIRLTTLAQEAHNLLTELQLFDIGLVYTRVNGVSPEDLQRYREVIDARKKLTADAASEDLPLDLPEFKSPYTPPVQ
jgi:hypothetical protein